MTVVADETHDGQFARLQTLQSVASVLAPLTALTAVLGYIGWVRSRAYFGYFGVSPALVDFSPQEYLFRSAAVGLGGVLISALAVAVVLILSRIIEWGLQRLHGRRRIVTAALTIIGVILVFSALSEAVPTVTRAAVPPISGAAMLSLGVVLILRFGASTYSQDRIFPSIQATLCVGLLILAGFWALTAYAENLGTGAAKDTDRNLESLTLVTVYTREPIDLAGSNIQASRVLGQDEKWSYRYTGARLLIYSNSRWFLIPEPSSSSYRASVTVLPDTDTIRIETARPQ